LGADATAVEKVAETSDDAEELIVWSFFDNLSPDDTDRTPSG